MIHERKLSESLARVIVVESFFNVVTSEDYSMKASRISRHLIRMIVVILGFLGSIGQ
jgi:hypothetical protein